METGSKQVRSKGGQDRHPPGLSYQDIHSMLTSSCVLQEGETVQSFRETREECDPDVPGLYLVLDVD